MTELEALLAKHAVPPPESGIPTWRCDVWQAGDGTWCGHFAVQVSLSPSKWVCDSPQGFRKTRHETEAVVLRLAKFALEEKR